MDGKYIAIGVLTGISALAGAYLFNNPSKVIRNYDQFTEAFVQPGDNVKGNRGLVRVIIDKDKDGTPDVTISTSFAITIASQIRERNTPSQEEIEFFRQRKAEYDQKR